MSNEKDKVLDSEQLADVSGGNGSANDQAIAENALQGIVDGAVDHLMDIMADDPDTEITINGKKTDQDTKLLRDPKEVWPKTLR